MALDHLKVRTAIRFGISRANRLLDWQGLTQQYGYDPTQKIVLQVTDGGSDIVGAGFILRNNQLEAIRTDPFQNATTIIRVTEPTFWRLLGNEVTMVRAFYTERSVTIEGRHSLQDFYVLSAIFGQLQEKL